MRTRIVSTDAGVIAEDARGPGPPRNPDVTGAGLERTCWLVATDLIRWDGPHAQAFAIAKTLFHARAHDLQQARLWALVARAIESILAPPGHQTRH